MDYDKTYRASLCEYIRQIELTIAQNNNAIVENQRTINVSREIIASNRRQEKLNRALLRDAKQLLLKAQKKAAKK